MTPSIRALFQRFMLASWPILSYWAYAAFYTIIQRVGTFETYKIAKSDPSRESLKETLFRCLQLQLMYWMIEYFFGDDHMYAEGSEIRVFRILPGMIAIDTYQYCFHRALHEVPLLYRTIHKVHHKYCEPFAFAGFYQSFAEGLSADVGCVIFATLLCGLRAEESILLASLASAKTVSIHCGYMLPFDPFTHFPNNAVYHRLHHTASPSAPVAFQQPFFTFWDRLLGTYPKTSDKRK